MKKWKVFAVILGCILCFSCCGKDKQDNGKPTVEPEETPIFAETEIPTETPVETETLPSTASLTPTVSPAQAESPAEGTSQEIVSKTNGGNAGQGQKYYAVTSVNVWSLAGTGGAIKGTLSRGEEIEGTGVTEQGWMQVLYSGEKCFVYGDYLSGTPVPEEEPEEKQPLPYEQPAGETVSSDTYSTWAFTAKLPESWQGKTGVIEEENGWGFYDVEVPDWSETKKGRVVSLRYYNGLDEWDTSKMEFKGLVGTSKDGSRYYILEGPQGLTFDSSNKQVLNSYSGMRSSIEEFKAGIVITE